ncbi:hypothetical protein LV475_05580 [Guyparkeria hydrothermalis]|uniref:hypothetical protein n=1 Tax=Guyparkeria hydrothermalis TaxID=923 RepID=UPI00202015B9|nr:hypothetical protein [Guyparkeria hydrothermalis]MCL7751064.1 hypothetical protein [Guyparkeria hydrothermalis]
MTYDIVNVGSNPAEWLFWHQSVFSDWDLLDALENDADFRDALGIDLPIQPDAKSVVIGNTDCVSRVGDRLDSYRNQVEEFAAPVTVQANQSGLEWLGARLEALNITGETVAIFGSGSDADHQAAIRGKVPIRDWVRMQHCMMITPEAEEYHYWSWKPDDWQPRALVRVEPDERFQLRLLKAEKALYKRRMEHTSKAAIPAESV